ncbi:MAG: hypothetical protein IJ737_00630 [Ruminococcus sp.]|nr:hypothetical protein [Ruminococcus sp.]
MQEQYYEELGMTEKELLEKYPFTTLKNIWSLEMVEGNWYGLIPTGWRKAFGKELLEEMAAEYDTFSTEYRQYWVVEEVKEKYGELRIYTGPTTKNMLEIIDKYTKLSRHHCIECGEPCKQRDVGWIFTMCDKCFDEMRNRTKKK